MTDHQRVELSGFTAWASVCVALLSLLGWVNDVGFLTSVFPGLPTMVPMTAMLTLVASWTLLQIRHAPGTAHAVLSAWLLISAALAILLFYGAEMLRLIAVPIAREGASGVSAPITATMLLGIGLSLLLLRHGRFIDYAQWIALSVLFISVLTLCAYMFYATVLYQLLPATGTSILSSLVSILLAIGCLGLRPADGIMAALTGNTTGAHVSRRLLLLAAAMPVAIGIASWGAMHTGLLDTESALALLIWGTVAALVVSTWLGAMQLKLAVAALEKASRALQRADANKDRFMTVLAHELRNPLAPLRSVADLLRRPDAADPQKHRHIGDIMSRQVEHMSRMIEDLLDLARVRQGLIDVARGPVDLHAVCVSAVEQVQPLMAQRRHRLEAKLAALPPAVVGDERRLIQVVVNLLVNAAKFTPDGGAILLELRAGPDQAEIVVRDSGIGIDSDMLAQVFETFSQVERSPERGHGGLGIGLALVRCLVELHGGTVEVSSEGRGKGSTFLVKLPCQCKPGTRPQGAGEQPQREVG